MLMSSDERLSDHEFAERVMLIIVTICGESIIAGTMGLNFARTFIAESMEVLGDCNLTPDFAESIVRCTTKVIYNIYHKGFEKEEGIEVQKVQATCAKFFDFLLSQVSPKMYYYLLFDTNISRLSKSLKVNEFITLAT